MLPPLLVIGGPTGVGKTAAAVALAETLPLEIVSADSRQVYRGMDAATGKPTVRERAEAPHHLIDVVDPDDRYHAARFRHDASPLGRELDSLADVISFGVAPASLAYAVGMNGGWDAVALLYFAACGISRLARYNVTADALAADTGRVRYFEGTPIPTSTALVLLLALLAWLDRTGARLPLGEWRAGGLALHPLVLLFVLSGSLMISKTLRIPKP